MGALKESFLEFEEAVTQCIEWGYGVTRSDAQGIMEVPANERTVMQGWNNRQKPIFIAIMLMSEATV